MFKVLVWDYTGESEKWCKSHLDTDVEIVHTIIPAELVPEILVQTDSWDWLLIFERNMRTTFYTTIRALKLPLEKIIYALDVQSWTQKPKAMFTLLNDSWGGIVGALFLTTVVS